MSGWFCHASGIMSMTASGSDKTPLTVNSSRTLSNAAESLPPGSTIGYSNSRSSPNFCDCMLPSLDRAHALLPRTVLISPLWAAQRIGCARSHDGNVLVENREWTRQKCDANMAWFRSW